MNQEKNREKFEFPKQLIGDFTSEDGWNFEGDFYDFVQHTPINGDDVWYIVIAKRERDGKFFAFEWGYGDGEYYYEPVWTEVFPKTITTTIYE